jgi:membrane-bound lytic murein transglycosylase B
MGPVGGNCAGSRRKTPRHECTRRRNRRRHTERAQVIALLEGAGTNRPSSSDLKPAETVKPWFVYRPIFITEARIAAGVDFFEQNRALLTRVQTGFRFRPSVVASWRGAFYGRITGK